MKLVPKIIYRFESTAGVYSMSQDNLNVGQSISLIVVSHFDVLPTITAFPFEVSLSKLLVN